MVAEFVGWDRNQWTPVRVDTIPTLTPAEATAVGEEDSNRLEKDACC